MAVSEWRRFHSQLRKSPKIKKVAQREFLMDILGIAVNYVYGKSTCAECGTLCGNPEAVGGIGGALGLAPGYLTPCCGKKYCERHMNGWGRLAKQNGGVCQKCGCEVG
jgi:hypothetical protein